MTGIAANPGLLAHAFLNRTDPRGQDNEDAADVLKETAALGFLDAPLGTRKAAAELQRVLAPGGQLLFSLPVGRPRVEFNAHRVHDPREVASWFALELVEFAGVDDLRAEQGLAAV